MGANFDLILFRWLSQTSGSTRRLWFFLFACGLIASCQSEPARNSVSIEPNVSPAKAISGEHFFGIHIHRIDAIKKEDGTQGWPNLSFTTWRLWDAGVTWMNLEPEEGGWDFSKLDRYVALAAKHNVEVLLPLGLTPGWASARPAEVCPYGRGCAAEPRDIRAWENYVRMVATRYRGQILSYEIWNEPDFIGSNPNTFFSGTPEKLVELAMSAYRVIKSINPNATVTTPATVAELERLVPYLRLGGGQFADVVAGHFYTSPPENLVPLITRFKSVMAKYGLENKPIWNTESGFLITNPREEIKGTPGSGVFERVLNESEAAAYVPRSLILSRANGIERTYWYAWDNFRMGLSKEGTGTPNLAGRAYNQVVQWLENASIEKCSVSDKTIWLCNLSRTDDRFWVVWSASDATQWAIPPDWKVRTVQTLDGQTAKVNSSSLFIGPSPLMLSSQD